MTHRDVTFTAPSLPRPKWGPLGEIVFARTYARWIESEMRRERWPETVERVTRFSLSLDPMMGQQEEQAEGEALYRTIHDLQGFVSGRTLWMGGSEFSYSTASSIANFNCFGAETTFLTRQGYMAFSDFSDGDQVEVMTQYGSWKPATVRQFGVQKLLKVTLHRGRAEKVVYATADHRWKVRRASSALRDTTTAELQAGDAIPTVRRNAANPVKPCAIAIQHGIVYGDGTLNRQRGATLVALQSDKRELARYFTTGVTLNPGSKGGEAEVNSTTITALPWNWKELPPLSANSEYLLGFLMGWFAADGSNTGTPSLSNKDAAVLEWARSALALVGIYTSDVQLMRTVSPFDGTEKPSYRLNIHREGVGQDFFLRAPHIAHAEARAAQGREMNWRVASVEETEREEPVWCVQEPETETFVLENGLLTRNCSSHSISSADDLHDLVYLLMSGTGGGPRLTKEVIEAFNQSHPIGGQMPDVTFVPYAYIPGGPEHTSLDGDTLTVGDSRAGWGEVVADFVRLLLEGRASLIVDANYIRPKGTRLKSFGGYASGPEPLIEGLQEIAKILAAARERGRVTDMDLLDICCLIGRLVVAGGTRRSALMILGDTPEFSGAKTGEWYITHPWRSQANITVVHKEKPDQQTLDSVFEQLLQYGEPGFINERAAQSRRPRFNGINPCAGFRRK